MIRSCFAACLGFFLLLTYTQVAAQDSSDKRAQYPLLLSNSYIGVHAGYIDYPFTNALLNPGYKAATIVKPFPALRIVLGHQFSKFFSVQISYMRPILWVEYRNVNGDNGEHAVFMNIAGFTGKYTQPVYKKLSVFAEGGLSIITRSGFIIHNNTETVVSSANYASYEFAGGMQYALNKRWDLTGSVTYAAGKKDVKQPHTLFYSAGIIYNMRPLSKEAVKRNSSGGYIFPKNTLQIGFSTNSLGYGINYWFSKAPIPIFWDGNIRVDHGFALQYEHNAFHGRRFFSLDWGTNISFFQTNINKDQFFTASLFPMFRFLPLRTKAFDLYFNYTLAGPTYFSAKLLDNRVTGEHFTFYDFMGMGLWMGKKRNVNLEFRIAHYSNGNLFYNNPGILIPLCFNLGYTF